MSEFQSNKKNFFLQEMFPNQFNTIPDIIIWTLVFLLDVVLVFWVAHLLGFQLPIGAASKLAFILYMVIAFILFCIESWLYNLIKH